ncbi:MAG: hypothetical protein LBB88_00025 [Planctomycetaceae bacterium]|nr:hypothetical protein [Planctomycetaceae bacterium]
MDSTIIKINSDLPSANADATFRRKVAYLVISNCKQIQKNFTDILQKIKLATSA